MKYLLLLLALVVLLAACSNENDGSNPPPSRDEYSLTDEVHKPIDKARNVEQIIQDDAEKKRKAMEEQGG